MTLIIGRFVDDSAMGVKFYPINLCLDFYIDSFLLLIVI